MKFELSAWICILMMLSSSFMFISFDSEIESNIDGVTHELLQPDELRENEEPISTDDYQGYNTKAPQDPYPIYGYVYQYNGAAGIYSPIPIPGANVNVTWQHNGTGAWITLNDISIATGQYCVDLLNYSEGGIVFINVTSNPLFGNLGYNYTILDTVGVPGGCQIDAVCGVPYNVTITNFPANVNISEPTNITYEIQDINGMIAGGYFTPNPPGPVPDGNMDWFSSDVLFINDASHPLQFDGFASPTPGYHVSSLTFGSAGVHWLNISEGGQFELNPYLTPWGMFLIDNTIAGYYDDWDNITITVIGVNQPLLNTIKTAPATANSGETIMYTITITNIGLGPAENITINETYSPFVTFVDSNPPPDIGNNVWSASIPNLAPLESFIIFINVTINTTTPLGTWIFNNITSNYTDSLGIYLPERFSMAVTTVIDPLIQIIKSAPDFAHPGRIMSYTITYQNIGTDTAYNVWLNESYPVGITYLNSTPVPDVPDYAWYLGNLIPGESGVIQINMTVNSTLVNGTVLLNWIFCNYSSDADGFYQKSAIDNASTLIVPFTGYPNSSVIGNIRLNTTSIAIMDYDLRDAATNLSMLNMQLDVGLEYYFYVNITDFSGVNNVNRMIIQAFYDRGSEATSYGIGSPNTEFSLQYSWLNSDFSLASTHTELDPEIKNVWGVRNSINQTNLELRVYFTLGEQIRHAPGESPIWDNASGIWHTNLAYNDLFSWNFNIHIMNNDSFSSLAYDEFGVYQYTSISAGDVSTSGLPGQVVEFPWLDIEYSSNDDYSLGVFLNNTLTKIWPTTTPNDTIALENIYISGGWLLNAPFTGIGNLNTLYYYPNHDAPEWGTRRSLSVQFRVYVPLNILGGTYVGSMTYLIEQI